MRSVESQREDRTRPLTEPVELRVHGVGGASPEILLGHPHPVLVAGDDTAGFYRPSSIEGETGGLEAYSWGGITSRSGSRALWLLVLPFALSNAAGFMMPRGDTLRLRLARSLLRLIALAVTVLFVLWAGGLALDLIAYQCGGNSACTVRHWWLSFFENPFFTVHPTRRLAVAMVFPAGLIYALRRATTFTRTRYEEAFAAEPVGTKIDEEPHEGDPAGWAGLPDLDFWHSSDLGRRLGAAHIAGATAALAGATSYACWRLLGDAGYTDNLNAALVVAAIIVGLLAVVVTISEGRGPTASLSGLGWSLVAITAFANLVSGQELASTTSDLPGYSRAALITGLVTLILAVLLMAALGSREMMPAVATTSIGVFAMGSFLAGSHVRLADLLGDRAASSDQPAIVYSTAYDWFALASFGVILTAGVTVLIAFFWLRRRHLAPETLEAINKRYDHKPLDPERRAWVARISRAETISSLVNRADQALTALLVMVVAGAIGFYWIRTFGSGSPFGSIGLVPNGLRPVVPLASWIGSMLPLLALGIMYQSFRNPGTRRRVSMIWDIVTFWPRWYHPLAPPAYSARAVPELGIRLGRLSSEGATITLSGHSQGSVIAAASIVRLPESITTHVSLLTHGSPLGRLYARFFPAYFGSDTIRSVRDRVGGRWINLFRSTDPIGGPVGVVSIDTPCIDPETDEQKPGDPLPAVRGHAFYAGTRAYQAALNELARRFSEDSP